MLTVLAKFFLMSNDGSSVEAIRKVSTYLTEESFLCGDITVLTPLPMGGGDGGGAACLCLIPFYSKSPVTPSFTRLKKLVQLLLELFFEVVGCVVDLFC